MQQYSPKNQAWILTQYPEATECRGMKQWNKQGRQVIKGSKAIRIATPTGIANVFDVSQTEPMKANTAKQARRAAGNVRVAAQESEYDVYATNTAGMEHPPSFQEWQQVQREAALLWDEPLNRYDAPMPATAAF